MKKVVFLFLFLFSCSLLPLKAQEGPFYLVDSALLYDSSAGVSFANIRVPDTLIYEGTRFITTVDLPAWGVRYSPFPESRSSRTRFPADTVPGYTFVCDHGSVYYRSDSSGFSFRPLQPKPAVSLWFQGNPASASKVTYLPFFKVGDEMPARDIGLVARKVYLAKFLDIPERQYPRKIIGMDSLEIVPGRYDDPAALGHYISRKMAKNSRFRGMQTVMRIRVDAAGRAGLLSCSRPELRPFLSRLISSMPAGSFTGRYEVPCSEVRLDAVRINPVIDYSVDFCSSSRNVIVRYR